jgi:hypothetical protein
MRFLKAAAIFIAFACALAPGARAEYAVLRSGMRIHITGYENMGSFMRLHVAGGTVDVAIEDIVTIEPEEVFAAITTPKSSASPTDRFPELIAAAAKKYGLDPQLLSAVAAAESNFDPRAISRKNAQGVMQLLPQTSARLEVLDPFDPAQSIDAGARYLKELLDRFNGNVKYALAAYNAGPERVMQYGGVPPYRETQDYVTKITKSPAQKPLKAAAPSKNATKNSASRIAPPSTQTTSQSNNSPLHRF